MEINSAVKILSVLAHEGRMALLQTLVRAGEQGASVGTLAETTSQNLKTVSAQLQLMADAGIVHVRREGKQMIYGARFETIGALFGFIMHDCCEGNPALLLTVRRACAC